MNLPPSPPKTDVDLLHQLREGVTLTSLYTLLYEIVLRQRRIETRLVRLMQKHAMDANGDSQDY